jgi:hypothetical protein
MNLQSFTYLLSYVEKGRFWLLRPFSFLKIFGGKMGAKILSYLIQN